ncbi:MAG: hypothetical protein ABWZ82_08565 [Candidatus Limnocylindrales bacterium]
MSRWTCDACGESNLGVWAGCARCRELRPVTADWTGGEVLVALYPGKTQEDAATRYAQHVTELGSAGYEPVATSWGEERPSAGTALFAAHLEEAYRIGTLLVTYRRRPA